MARPGDADHDRPHRARDHRIFYGIEHFRMRRRFRGALKSDAGVDSGRPVDYVTGAALLVGGGSFQIEDADRGYLRGRLDSAARPCHLWACPDRCARYPKMACRW